MLIADVAQINSDTGLPVEQLTQFQYGEAMAGVNTNDRRALLQERLDFRRKLLRQVFD